MGTSRSRDDPMLVMGWCIMLLLLFDDASIKTCRLLLLLFQQQQQHRLVLSLLAPLAAPPPPDLLILVVVNRYVHFAASFFVPVFALLFVRGNGTISFSSFFFTILFVGSGTWRPELLRDKQSDDVSFVRPCQEV